MKVMVIEDTVAAGRDIYQGNIEEIPDDIVHRFVRRGQVLPLDPNAAAMIEEATNRRDGEGDRPCLGLARPQRREYPARERRE